MKQYLVRVWELQHEFESKGIPLRVDLILRTQNKETDLMSRLCREELRQLPQEVLIEII